MIKKIIILIVSIFLLGIVKFGFEMYDFAKGVKADIPKNIEYFEKNGTIKLLESELDTINIDNYDLLFFHPNEKEFEELIIDQGENSGLYEVDSDYVFYANKVYDSISKTELKVKVITERIIKYSTNTGIKYLDRLKNKKHPYGIIFNSVNCNPKIEFGIMTDIGMLQELTRYKKNCK